jgi:hypothetical protein
VLGQEFRMPFAVGELAARRAPLPGLFPCIC